MPLQIVVFTILIALVVLMFRSYSTPGIAAALVWSMIALESVIQQGNDFLLTNGSFMNYLIAAIAGLAATFAILNGRYKGQQVPAQVWLYIALTGLAMLSYVWSVSPGHTFENMKLNLPYIITFGLLAPMCVFNERQLRAAITVLIYFGALVVLATTLSEFGRRGIILTSQNGQIIEANPLAAGSFAAYVGIAALFSVWGKKILSPMPLVKVGIVCVCVIAIIKSGSRGQLIAFAVSSIFWLPIMARAAVKKSTILAMACAILLTGFAIWMIGQLGWGDRWELDSLLADQQGRLDMARYMISVNFSEGPVAWIFGLGSSSSFRYLDAYPHNIYAETLAELGLVGFTILSAILITSFRDGFKMMKSRSVSGQTRVNVSILMALFSYNIMIGFKQGSLLTSSLSVFSLGLTIAWLNKRLSDSKAGNNKQIIRVRPAPAAHSAGYRN